MTTDITYIEQFYFIMYFILGIVASNIVYFTKAAPTSKVRLTENLLFKLSYWPILLGTFLLITLIKFY